MKRYRVQMGSIKIGILLCMMLLQPFFALGQYETGRRLDFTENKGQWPNQALYGVQHGCGSTFFEKDGFTIVLRSPKDSIAPSGHYLGRYRYHSCRLAFENATPDVNVVGLGQTEDYENYYLGNDSTKWASGCRIFGTLEYQSLYPNIDMKVYCAESAIKYEFIVGPGANPSEIAMIYDSIVDIKLMDDNLQIHTTAGDWIEYAPYTYQETSQGRVVIPSRYVLNGNKASFDIGTYDPLIPLIIDPYLVFSTYTGSSADNWGTTAAYDNYKNVYTAGLVFANGYPTSLGAYDSTYNGNADIGIFKFDSTGTQRIYATYLGGSQADMPHSMYVNSLDELIVMGTTGSRNFPTSSGALSRMFNGGQEIGYLNSYSIYYPDGSDLVITRFNPDGTQLQASTYLGGSGNDGLNYKNYYNRSMRTVMQGNDSLYYNYGDGARGEIITDNLNNVYIGSTTFSNDFFPAGTRSLQSRNHGGQEGVVVKIDYNLSNIIWGTYYGGGNDDAIYSIDVDNDYNLVMCGGTTSNNLNTTPSAYHPTHFGGPADAFIAKISYNGDRLLASTYYGSNAYDQAYFVRCGRHDEVFVFGQTCAPGSSLIQNAYYNVPNSGQFIARFTPNLEHLVWSTTFGTGNGRPNISPTAFGADICNRVYAVGWGRDFVGYNGVDWNTLGTTNLEVTPNAYQSTTDGQDFYLFSLSSDASQLEYASFFGELHNSGSQGGSDHVDGGTSRFDRLGTLYQSVCASCGNTSAFPTTPGAWSSSNMSHNCNNALFRFNINEDYAVAEFVQPPAGCAPYDVTFLNTGRGASHLWDFGDGTTSTETNPTHQYASAGSYTVRLISTLPGGCVNADTCERTVMVIGNGSRRAEPTISCNGTSQQIGLQPMVGCTYRWIQGNVSDSSIANPWVYENGDYIMEVSAVAGCSETDTFNVTFIDLIDSLIITPTSCPFSCDGQVVAVTNTQQAISSILYNWDGIVLPDSILIDQCADGIVHMLRVSDDRCHDTASYVIKSPSPMVIQKESLDILCIDSCIGSIHLWSDQNIDTSFNGLCEGEYMVALQDTLGCEYLDTTFIIVDHMLDNVHAWAEDTTLFLTESTTLHATEIANATYHWTPEEDIRSPRKPSTDVTPSDTSSNYVVCVTDSLGCSVSDTVSIHCIIVNCGEGNIFIPNAFTPNNDGVNDLFCITGENIVEFHLMIFTRWGELIYESNQLDECWDGRYKDNWCMSGVYAYVCQITCEAGIETQFKGNITLIR